jgi:hypothetical protein
MTLPAAPTPGTNKADFQAAVTFIRTDIERELQLARLNGDGQLTSVISPGGGNLLAALGLLCYTEFGGKLRFNYKKATNPTWDDSGRNFGDFFELLGPDYVAFRASFPSPQDVYRIFRCGLAHEYYVKRSCTVFMLDGGHPCGIGRDSSGRFFLVVETYLAHLLAAFAQLEHHLFP